MAEISLQIVSHKPSLEAVLAAVEGIGSAFAAAPALAERLAQRFGEFLDAAGCAGGEIAFQGFDEIITCRVEMPARGASGATFFLEPSDRFRELVAAIAGEGDFEVVDVHGWPVLSLVGCTASVTEAGGVNNPARGGAL